MDPPKTRRESKKTAKEKRADVYSGRHVRLTIAAMKNGNDKPQDKKKQ
jgi:hypothetical protein